MKNSAATEILVLRDEQSGLYWSDRLDWVNLDSADRFTFEQSLTHTPFPENGLWVPLDLIKTGL